MTASAHYHRLRDSQRLLLSRDEVRWHLRVPEQVEQSDVVIDFGCGLQRTPHIMVEMVDVLTALGVPVTAVAGPQWCCGVPLDEDGTDEGASTAVTRASVRHLARHRPQTVIQSCGAWWPQVGKLRDAGEDVPFELEHLSQHILTALEHGIGSVSWRPVPERRVLLHLKAGDEPNPEIRAQRANSLGATDRCIPLILGLVPSVEIVGEVELPALGAPCLTDDDDRSILDSATPEERAQVRADLAAQAARAGADTIVCAHHRCYEEWGKFGTDELPVRHYVSVLAEAMGLARPDRFHACWARPSIAAIVEETRPYWQSWDDTRDEATAYATQIFDARD